MHLPGIGPRRESRDDVELSQKPTDDFVGICLGAQPIELGHDLHEGLLHVSNRVLRVVLTLLVETALALDEFFAVEILIRNESPALAGGNPSGNETGASATRA